MNQKQLEILKRVPKIKVKELENISDRTLLYGFGLYSSLSEPYKLDVVFHLYLEGEMFHYTVYFLKSKFIHEFKSGQLKLKSFKYRDEITTEQFLCDDLLFRPECCDYDFCSLLKSKGTVINFTEFEKDRSNKKYYGLLFNDLKKEKKNG